MVRSVMLGHLVTIDPDLGDRVAAGLGHEGEIIAATPAVPIRTDLPAAPSLSMLARAAPTLAGRTVGLLVTDGASSDLVGTIIAAVAAADAQTRIVCPTIGGVTLDDGTRLLADHQLGGGPSVLFDAVAVIASDDGAAALLGEAAAVAWVHDAWAHLKVIGASDAAVVLLDAAGVDDDDGVIMLDGDDAERFAEAAGNGRIWGREPDVRTVY
jgi:catalase